MTRRPHQWALRSEYLCLPVAVTRDKEYGGNLGRSVIGQMVESVCSMPLWRLLRVLGSILVSLLQTGLRIMSFVWPWQYPREVLTW